MKHIKITTAYWALVFPALLVFSSCFKELKEPKIDFNAAFPEGKIYTLNELKNLPTPYTFDTAAWVHAIVTMDEKNGNLYKQIYVQDSTDAIRLIFTESTGFSAGDSVGIYLKGKTIVNNHGTYEIQTLQPDSSVIVIANRKIIEPLDVTIADILTRSYDLMLVRVHDVQFTNSLMGTTWADPTKVISAVSDTLEDCSNNKIVLRTSSYAAFAGQKVPCGKGSMVAIAGAYNTTMQLIVRYMSEVDMTGDRCDGTPGVCQKTILEESFAEGQGTFDIFDVTGEPTWIWKQLTTGNCMEMTASTFQNEDWLISPAMDLNQLAHATLYFSHTINKSGGISKEDMKKYQTVWISKDYVSDNPNNATWTQWQLSDENLPSGTNWIYMNVGLPIPQEFISEKKVRIAFKYTCDESFSATWRIKNVLVRGEEL